MGVYRDLEKRNAWRRAWAKRNYDRIKAEWKEQPPISRAANAAHHRVVRALERGEIERPSTCSQCGMTGFIEAAHENYTERLAIRWLCRSCHRRWDSRNSKQANAQLAQSGMVQ